MLFFSDPEYYFSNILWLMPVKLLFQILLPMDEGYLYAEFLGDMLRHFLCRVHRAMLAAGTAERNHKIGKIAQYHPAIEHRH